MENEKFYRGYVQVEHGQDFDSSGNPIPPHVHRVDINPYDVPPDDLPEGYTPKEKPVSMAVLIWDKLPQILIYAGLCVVILGVIWGCHHG